MGELKTRVLRGVSAVVVVGEGEEKRDMMKVEDEEGERAFTAITPGFPRLIILSTIIHNARELTRAYH